MFFFRPMDSAPKRPPPVKEPTKRSPDEQVLAEYLIARRTNQQVDKEWEKVHNNRRGKKGFKNIVQKTMFLERLKAMGLNRGEGVGESASGEQAEEGELKRSQKVLAPMKERTITQEERELEEKRHQEIDRENEVKKELREKYILENAGSKMNNEAGEGNPKGKRKSRKFKENKKNLNKNIEFEEICTLEKTLEEPLEEDSISELKYTSEIDAGNIESDEIETLDLKEIEKPNIEEKELSNIEQNSPLVSHETKEESNPDVKEEGNQDAKEENNQDVEEEGNQDVEEEGNQDVEEESNQDVEEESTVVVDAATQPVGKIVDFKTNEKEEESPKEPTGPIKRKENERGSFKREKNKVNDSTKDKDNKINVKESLVVMKSPSLYRSPRVSPFQTIPRRQMVAGVGVRGGATPKQASMKKRAPSDATAPAVKVVKEPVKNRVKRGVVNANKTGSENGSKKGAVNGVKKGATIRTVRGSKKVTEKGAKKGSKKVPPGKKNNKKGPGQEAKSPRVYNVPVTRM